MPRCGSLSFLNACSQDALSACVSASITHQTSSYGSPASATRSMANCDLLPRSPFPPFHRDREILPRPALPLHLVEVVGRFVSWPSQTMRIRLRCGRLWHLRDLPDRQRWSMPRAVIVRRNPPAPGRFTSGVNQGFNSINMYYTFAPQTPNGQTPKYTPRSVYGEVA